LATLQPYGKSHAFCTFTTMPIPRKYLADFEENGMYHIYNRTNNKERLFLNEENKRFFLQRYKEMISPVADTYAWNLLPNHFHLVIKLKSAATIADYLQHKKPLSATEKKYQAGNSSFGELIEHYFKRFFQSYSLSFNAVHHRSGNLFYKPFKRVAINKASQLTMAIVYVHANAAKHGLTKDFTNWKWSSWHSILSDKPTLLARKDVIDCFGNAEAFIKVHHELAAQYYDCAIAIEE
jgi:putative transposase